MDKIFIESLVIRTKVGIHPWERVVAQPIEINIEIGLPSSKACQTDRIEDALDYSIVVEKVSTLLSNHSFSLLERLAEVIATLVLTEFSAPWTQIRIKKLCPHPQVKGLGVIIERFAADRQKPA